MVEFARQLRRPINAQIDANSGAIAASIVGPFTYNLASSDYYDGVFQISLGSESAYGDLQIESLTVGPATPIPAALPLFATGLGALGLLGWRRKRAARLPVVI